jgi:hypothetical protein
MYPWKQQASKLRERGVSGCVVHAQVSIDEVKFAWWRQSDEAMASHINMWFLTPANRTNEWKKIRIYDPQNTVKGTYK